MLRTTKNNLFIQILSQMKQCTKSLAGEWQSLRLYSLDWKPRLHPRLGSDSWGSFVLFMGRASPTAIPAPQESWGNTSLLRVNLHLPELMQASSGTTCGHFRGNRFLWPFVCMLVKCAKVNYISYNCEEHCLPTLLSPLSALMQQWYF